MLKTQKSSSMAYKTHGKRSNIIMQVLQVQEITFLNK